METEIRDETSHLDNLIECEKCTGWFENELITEFKEKDVCVDCEHELIKLAELQVISDSFFDKIQELQSEDLELEFREQIIAINAKILKHSLI